MSSPVTVEQRLADIIAARPGAASVLRRYGIDYSAGGQRSLVQACGARDVDPDEVRRAVIAARAEPDDVQPWADRPLAEVVQHIRERYHDRHRTDLPDLIELAHRVESRHGNQSDCPRGLAARLATLREDLEGHLDEEEQVVFPLILDGPREGVAPVTFAAARCEHDVHLQALGEIRRLTRDFDEPEHPCRSWRRLYEGLIAFERDLLDHVHLENNVLFPRAVAEGRL